MLPRVAPVVVEALLDLVRRRPRGGQPHAVGRGPLDALRAEGRDPHLGVGLLHGSRKHRDVVEVPVLSVMLEGLVGLPCPEYQIPTLLEPLPGLLGGDVERPEVTAPGHAHDETAVTEVVEHRQLLAQSYRVVQRQAVAHEADLDFLGQYGGRGREQVGRGGKAVGGAAVMLGEEHPVEAVLFGAGDEIDDLVVDLLAEPLVVIGARHQVGAGLSLRVPHTQEKPNLHGVLSFHAQVRQLNGNTSAMDGRRGSSPSADR